MNTTEHFHNFRPALIRLLARKRYGRPLTTDEISAASDLQPEYVEYIAHKTNWRGVPIHDALDFLRGCGLGVDDAKAWRRVVDYLSRKPSFRYLRTSPQWAAYYQPLLKAWRRSYTPNPDVNTWPPLRNLLIRLTPLLNEIPKA